MGHPTKVVSITGHRDLSAKDKQRLWAAMKALVDNASVDEIWFGGAKGTDNEGLRAALHHRGEKKTPRLVVVVPDHIRNQPRECWEPIGRADQVIELGLPIQQEDGFAAYQKRNEFLVEHATLLVAFWNGSRSGTGNTVNHAKKVGVKTKVITVGE